MTQLVEFVKGALAASTTDLHSVDRCDEKWYKSTSRFGDLEKTQSGLGL